MPRSLHVLIVDDSADDALLVVRELEKGGFDPEFSRVDSIETMTAALVARSWDIVVMDYTMPSFGAPEALATLRETGKDIPVILVSGTIGEDTAVAALRLGAKDYVLKDNLERLVPVVERELREWASRAARRDAQQKLSAYETGYRALFEASPLPMWVLDTKSLRFSAVNEAAVAEYGYTRDEFESLVIADISREKEDAKRGARAGTGDEGLTRHVRKDGTDLWVEMKSSDLVFGDDRLRLVLATNVTERVRAEEERARAETALRVAEDQLLTAQKMEAVGRLAGGVAHDFNNILSVVLSYAELVLADLKKEDPLVADLTEIIKAGRRAMDWTRQLLAFSRQQVIEPKVIDLNASITGMERMLERLLGADVEVLILPAWGLGKVRIDPGQIEQILMNLAVNARDAMPTGGRLILRTDNVEQGDLSAIKAGGLPAGRYVVLSVSDTGVGMSGETLRHVFEPFFTTKEGGRGTGLGLTMVFGIVQQGGGHLLVESEPGQGTVFKIYLPRVDAADAEVAPEPAAVQMERGHETILVVGEDDPARGLTKSILRKAGYTVLDARGAGEALLVSEQHEGEVHMVLADLALPMLSGAELAERLSKDRPHAKFLLLSDETAESRPPASASNLEFPCLRRPVTPEALTRKVREVLGR
jgi:two-component system cell cycle sensor histidine kinase/response regulator CckA